MTSIHPWLRFDPERAEKVLTGFLHDYVSRAGAEGVVLGLSGGLDSAVAAALAVDALGADRVDVVHLPGPSSSAEDAAVAQEVADHLGLDLERVAITAAIEALAPHMGDDRAVRANLQARLRMALLYARGQAAGRLVSGTSNKSELLVGYFTKHGDGGVDLAPLGDLYKTQVRALAEAIALPASVRERAPTAGLWEGQTDEAELGMSYATLDIVLAGIETQRPDDEIAEAAGLDLLQVRRVQEMIRATWHKRNPPPVPKLGYRTVGVDWRESTM